jgi:hypothetical protein
VAERERPFHEKRALVASCRACAAARREQTDDRGRTPGPVIALRLDHPRAVSMEVRVVEHVRQPGPPRAPTTDARTRQAAGCRWRRGADAGSTCPPTRRWPAPRARWSARATPLPDGQLRTVPHDRQIRNSTRALATEDPIARLTRFRSLESRPVTSSAMTASAASTTEPPSRGSRTLRDHPGPGADRATAWQERPTASARRRGRSRTPRS